MMTVSERVANALPIPQDSGFLRFLYRTVPGRLLLHLPRARWVSSLVGAYMSGGLSRIHIKSFVRKNHIDLQEYESDHFASFNDCFTRRIKEGMRPIDGSPDALISPCDGLLSAYHITKGTVIPAKQSRYSLCGMLQDEALAHKYEGGICLVFRLCVNHYHRYCYADDGTKEDNVFIPGTLHTVRPVALEQFPVFVQNCREYTVMHTAHFGDLCQIEVGAMLVGRIRNFQGAGVIHRGEEKGTFDYGGSTVILLIEKDKVSLPEAYFEATRQQAEIPVQMGQRLN